MRKQFLPAFFAVVGLVISIAAFVFLLITGMLHPRNWEETSLRRQVATGCIAVGLLIVAFAKRKNEEGVWHPRDRAFFYACGTLILLIVLEIATRSTYWFQNGYGLVIIGMLVYLAVLHLRPGNRNE